jgi:zinc transporter 2
MEGSPLEVNVENLKNDLMKLKGVTDCHDIHVWCLSLGKISMSCHLVSICPQETLKFAADLCRKKYNITHSTIQVESTDNKMKNACDDHDLH